MAPTLVYTAGISADDTSVVASNNGAMQAGDTRLAWISVSNSTVTSSPSGWDLLRSYTLASTRTAYLFRKIHAGGSEPSTATWTFGGEDNHSLIQAGVRGADPGDLDFTPTSATSSTGTPTAASGTTVRADQLVLVVFHIMVLSSSTTFTTPSGMDEELVTRGDGSNGHSAALFSQTFTGPGAIGSKASTSSPSGAWGATLAALPNESVAAGARGPAQPYTARRRAANF